MKITDITHKTVTVPLLFPFKTALRTVKQIENVLVTVATDDGHCGYGGAAPTAVITGDTLASIRGGIEHIRDNIIGMDIASAEDLFQKLNRCLIGNMSAKAAVDMAIYDLLAKAQAAPLYRFLGGTAKSLETDITISLDTPEKMAADSLEKVARGFTYLKIKVGNNPELDIQRLQAIHGEVGDQVKIRIDANQGWTPKEAVLVGNALADRGINIELLEQPVAARDFSGLRYVREQLAVPVVADESVFSPRDALDLVQMGAADGFNIKLMKCGGIYNAIKIAAIADAAGIPCMVGSMMESHLSVGAAAHFAASRAIVTRFDLDAPLFCSANPAVGGIFYQGSKVCFTDTPGLGVESLHD
ncbi:dipeptide epimerase [uncultured Desulfuromusa sp.]|uniref:dipeptide epimerase n=1 Tax=uncultured Desulfuromusa sp. TaxID=219183 RepID=UPI002AA86D4B|nr:dipeptide epimerase [uncultured Desulfuromusa sp.]